MQVCDLLGGSIQKVVWPFDYVVLGDHVTLNPLYLYNNAYGHKAWQSRDLPWVASTHKICDQYHLVL